MYRSVQTVSAQKKLSCSLKSTVSRVAAGCKPHRPYSLNTFHNNRMMPVMSTLRYSAIRLLHSRSVTATNWWRLNDSYNSRCSSHHILSPEFRSNHQHVIPIFVSFRYFDTSLVRFMAEESKVEKTLEAIKETAKKEVADKEVMPVAESETKLVEAKAKLPLLQRIVAELKHYYHGFRLLYFDTRVAIRLLWKILNGKTLMRREHRQLVRTTADLFRLVPFLVFIIVPFMEFLLPVVLKLFPNMLPSTFKEEDKEKEKLRKKFKVKLEMAKFLQDTMEATALQRKGSNNDDVREFVKFMDNIRTSGRQTSNEEILKYSKLFEDEITLDNLNYAQLRALCRMLELPTVGTSYVLRFQLEMQLRKLETDDKMIEKEGLDSLAVWELQEACRLRGMRSYGVPETRLKTQLQQWLDLHLNMKIPTSLLLLSRTLYLPEYLSTEDQLKATISALSDTTAEEAKVKMSEVAGARVDNKSKLELIRQEEQIILQEKMEAEKLTEELAAKLKKEELKDVVKEVMEPIEPSMVDSAPTVTASAKEILQDKAKELLIEEQIDSRDLEQMENILERIAERKLEFEKEVEELATLKEEFSEYKENVQDLKEAVTQAKSLSGIGESKAALRLGRKLGKMIDQMDVAMKNLSKQKEAILVDIKSKEGHIQHVADQEKEAEKQQIMDQISSKKRTVITIDELLIALQDFKSASKDMKTDTLEAIIKVLDEDQDGVIDYKDAMKMIELVGKEKLKVNANQLTEIMSVLKKEQEIEEEKKQKTKKNSAASTEQQQQQQAVEQTAQSAVSNREQLQAKDSQSH